MKKIMVAICLMAMTISGCKSMQTVGDAARGIQPDGVRYFREVPWVFDWQGDSITITAPRKITRHPDGSITEEPYEDSEGRPVLARLRVKDTSIEPPKTWLDFGLSLIKAGLAAFGIHKAFGTLDHQVNALADITGRLPMTVNPKIVAIDREFRPSGSGSVTTTILE